LFEQKLRASFRANAPSRSLLSVILSRVPESASVTNSAPTRFHDERPARNIVWPLRYAWIPVTLALLLVLSTSFKTANVLAWSQADALALANDSEITEVDLQNDLDDMEYDQDVLLVEVEVASLGY